MNVTSIEGATSRGSRVATLHTFPGAGGAALFYRAWIPEGARAALVLFHRGHEHSGRWQETVDALGLDEVAVFAWDARGHGKSPGERGWASDLGTVVQDADCFVRWISSEHKFVAEDLIVLAHSVGAVIAAAWAHDYAPRIRALILATPAFRVRLYVPFAVPLLRLKQKLFGPGFVRSYVKGRMLTHDPMQAAAYAADPLIFPQIAVNMLLGLYDTSTRLIDDAGAIDTPTMVMVAGADFVVSREVQRQFFERLGTADKKLVMLPGFYHAVFHEKERHLAVQEVREFVLEQLERAPARPELLRADKRGYTRSEFDWLRGPAPPKYVLLRWAMQTVGRLSRGISIGLEHGFDSGVMLDYVYENRSRGVAFVGRLIDRVFLDGIGWRGIRIRKTNLERLLERAIRAAHEAGSSPVRILDVASGPGRYLLETIVRLSDLPIEALLRDYKRANVEAARELAKALGLGSVAVEKGDAFDGEALAQLTPRHSIAIASGLYELFPQNEPVLRSLRGIFAALEPGGWLIYTNQPWHPQLELIAWTLGNREGDAWVMRRRTQAEMDALAAAAGFVKVEQVLDPYGIFSVSLARKP